MDMSNFDSFPSELNFPPDEFSGWDDDFWALLDLQQNKIYAGLKLYWK